MFSLGIFIFGLVILLLGSEGVIKNAIRISSLTKIPTFIIGATIVAIGTSLPEMVVSFFGGFENAPSLALGNIIGSNIANIGVILGISLLLSPIAIGQTKTQKNMQVMLFVSLILFFVLLFDGITYLLGLFLIALGLVVVVWQVIQGKNDKNLDNIPVTAPKHPLIVIGLFIISLLALFIGGKLLVEGGVELANLFHVKKIIIGAVAVALGTSIPEMAVSISALSRNATRHEEKLVIGNILGSNIFNILFGVGILGLYGVNNFSSPISLFAFLSFTVIFCVCLFFYKGKRMPKYMGIPFLLAYITYVFFLFA